MAGTATCRSEVTKLIVDRSLLILVQAEKRERGSRSTTSLLITTGKTKSTVTAGEKRSKERADWGGGAGRLGAGEDLGTVRLCHFLTAHHS